MLKGLEQAEEIARRHWPKNKKWKVFLIFAGIIAAAFLTIWAILYLLIWLVRGLTAGGYRNRDLYMPSMRRRRR